MGATAQEGAPKSKRLRCDEQWMFALDTTSSFQEANYACFRVSALAPSEAYLKWCLCAWSIFNLA